MNLANRRAFIRNVVVGGTGLGLAWPGPSGISSVWAGSAGAGRDGTRATDDLLWTPVICDGSEFPRLPLPEGKRVPFGWRAIPVPAETRGLVLRWAEKDGWEADRFRLTLAIDERQEKRVEVRLAESKRVLGIIDIKFGYQCQPFELRLSPADASLAMQEGLRLRVLDDVPPLWIFGDNRPAGPGHEYLLPHLLARTPRTPWDTAFARLASLASVQPFGWIEGCVLEGLSELERSVPTWRLRASQALDQHLDLFFPGNDMIMEDPRSVPSDNHWFSVEAALMIPALWRRRTSHAMIDHAYSFLNSRPVQVGKGWISVHAEGCFTLAYPLATIARAKGDERGLSRALDHLIMRREQLVRGDILYQRHWSQGPDAPNWARGVAWYMMGHCRVLAAVGEYGGEKREAAAAELARACRWILPLQREDGLWTCYASEPATGPETSGSAGISAALLLAHRLGLASSEVIEPARRCLAGLERYLHPDGFLEGVTQSNKGGEVLQRSGYRVNSQMGLGLAVQLAALLRRTGTSLG